MINRTARHSVELLVPGDIVHHVCAGATYCPCEGRLCTVISTSEKKIGKRTYQVVKVLVNCSILYCDDNDDWFRADFYKLM